MLKFFSPLIFLFWIAEVAYCSGDGDLPSRILHYGHLNIDLPKEAKRLCGSPIEGDRILSAGLIVEYPHSFDRKTIEIILNSLLADESDRVKIEALDALDALANLPPYIDAGKPEALKPFVKQVQKLKLQRNKNIQKQAKDTLISLQRRIHNAR